MCPKDFRYLPQVVMRSFFVVLILVEISVFTEGDTMLSGGQKAHH